ncbi:MAG: hypothetical protein AAFV95_02875 [Bacteroidota bacterium]
MKNVIHTVLLIFSFLIFGCKTTIIEEVPVEVVPDFEELPESRDPFKSVFQMQKYDNSLLLQSTNAHHYYDENGVGRTAITGNQTSYIEVMNEHLTLRISERFIVVEDIDPTRRSDTPGVPLHVQLDSLLPEGSHLPIHTVRYSRSLGYIDKNNVLLLPYYIDGRLDFAILKFEPGETIPNYYAPKLLSAETFEFTGEFYHYQDGIRIHEVEGGFVMTAINNGGTKIYRIAYDGSYESVTDHISLGIYRDYFEYKGRLYTWIRPGSSPGELIILTCDPDGRGWKVKYRLQSDIEFHYIPTEDALFACAFASNQLFLVTMTEEEMLLEALDNEQFWSYQIITDVEKFGEHVYISTLSGFYRRNWQEFIDSKLK